MTENIITWNVANWITVVLMALLGFFLFGLVVSAIKKKRDGSSDGGPTVDHPATAA